MSLAVRCDFCPNTSKATGPSAEAARKAAGPEGFLRPAGPKGQVDMCPSCGAVRLDPAVTFFPDEEVPEDEILEGEPTP